MVKLSLKWIALVACCFGVAVGLWWSFKQVGSPLTIKLGRERKALVQLRLTTLFGAIQSQRYSQLYSTWASSTLQQNPYNKVVFLQLAYCAERHLGSLTTYDKTHPVWLTKGNRVYLVVNTEREKATTEEKLELVPDGLDYRLAGYYIASKNPEFRACIASISSPAKKASKQGRHFE
jgi:hypothetical protein